MNRKPFSTRNNGVLAPSPRDESSIRTFWNANPCGQDTVENPTNDFAAFLSEFDRERYRVESHIPHCLDRFDWAGKRVLEIGLGHGAESEQLIRRQAIWTGIDLTPESCRRVQQRLSLHDLPNKGVYCGSVRRCPFSPNIFIFEAERAGVLTNDEYGRMAPILNGRRNAIETLLSAAWCLVTWPLRFLRQRGAVVRKLRE